MSTLPGFEKALDRPQDDGEDEDIVDGEDIDNVKPNAINAESMVQWSRRTCSLLRANDMIIALCL